MNRKLTENNPNKKTIKVVYPGIFVSIVKYKITYKILNKKVTIKVRNEKNEKYLIILPVSSNNPLIK